VPGISKRQFIVIILLILVVPVGLVTKFYSGPAAVWVNDSLGGVFYEIFWCLLLFLFYHNSKVWKIAGSVFVVTCIIEFLQLWHPAFLDIMRRNFVGRTFLGTSFNWTDFIYYFLGSGIGFIIITRLQRLSVKNFYKDKS
jgi:glycopeptide antibiotics resistance protein